MTSNLLPRIGAVLYGHAYAAGFALALDVRTDTTRRWVSGREATITTADVQPRPNSLETSRG